MSNPGFTGPEGSIRFIVSVPSCASSPQKSWAASPELVRFVADFRLACGFATGEPRTGPSSSSKSIAAVADRAGLEVGRPHRPECPLDSTQSLLCLDCDIAFPSPTLAMACFLRL